MRLVQNSLVILLIATVFIMIAKAMATETHQPIDNQQYQEVL